MTDSPSKYDEACRIGLDERSKALRKVALQAMLDGGRGHLAPAFSLIEIVRVLYDSVLNFRATDPAWAKRDRFILSKGHGCLAQYALLADKGFICQDDLCGFCSSGGILGGHPERAKIPGVEASTGSLGHGLSIGTGFALRARMDKEAHRVYVVMGDGESNEGSVWEAALSAGKHGLENLTVLIDYNHMQSCGPTDEIQTLEPLADKWRAFNFGVAEVNGHDPAALETVLNGGPQERGKPTAIICHTVKGKGIRSIEGDLTWHHKARIDPDLASQLFQAIEEY